MQTITIRPKILERGMDITISDVPLKTGVKGPAGVTAKNHSGMLSAVYNLFGYYLELLLKEESCNAAILFLCYKKFLRISHSIKSPPDKMCICAKMFFTFNLHSEETTYKTLTFF